MLKNNRKVSVNLKTIFKRFIACSALALSLGIPTISAQNCEDKIAQASGLYEVGQFNKVIQLLKTCSDSLNNETIRWKSLRLIALAQLANKDNELARKTAIKFMEINPRYKPSSLKDPKEFVTLLKSIKVIPKLSLGFGFAAGTNQTTPSVINAFSVTDQSKKYMGKGSLQGGISGLYQFNSHIGLNVSIIALRKELELDHSFTNWSLTMTEELTYITLPINGRYTFDLTSKIKPYVQFGGYGSYLIFGNSSFFSNHTPSNQEYALENVSSLDRRERIDLGLTGGAGIVYKLQKGQIFFEGNFFRSFQNITNESERYNYNQLFYSYFYLDDNILLHNYSFNIGYSFYLNYKVVK